MFTTPTITGYKRYQPDSFAPDHVTWAEENRAAMFRIIGSPGAQNSHIENRVGDPAANPYLYLASQVASGVDGVQRKLDPGSQPKSLTIDATAFSRESYGSRRLA